MACILLDVLGYMPGPSTKTIPGMYIYPKLCYLGTPEYTRCTQPNTATLGHLEPSHDRSAIDAPDHPTNHLQKKQSVDPRYDSKPHVFMRACTSSL